MYNQSGHRKSLGSFIYEVFEDQVELIQLIIVTAETIPST